MNPNLGPNFHRKNGYHKNIHSIDHTYVYGTGRFLTSLCCDLFLFLFKILFFYDASTENADWLETDNESSSALLETNLGLCEITTANSWPKRHVKIWRSSSEVEHVLNTKLKYFERDSQIYPNITHSAFACMPSFRFYNCRFIHSNKKTNKFCQAL